MGSRIRLSLFFSDFHNFVRFDKNRALRWSILPQVSSRSSSLRPVSWLPRVERPVVHTS
jgi:hypothetical protein